MNEESFCYQLIIGVVHEDDKVKFSSQTYSHLCDLVVDACNKKPYLVDSIIDELLANFPSETKESLRVRNIVDADLYY